MTGLFSKFLAVFLALMMTGAAGLCPCINAICGDEPLAAAGPAAPAKAGCHQCDEPTSPAPANPAEEPDHCPNCQPLNADRPAPTRDAAAVDFVAIPFFAAPLPAELAPETSHRNIDATENIAIPPLLDDLFHSHCLLTR